MHGDAAVSTLACSMKTGVAVDLVFNILIVLVVDFLLFFKENF